MLNGMLWIARSGAQWRELPAAYGPWQSVHRRMYLWLRSQSIYKNPKTVLRIIKSMICCPKYDGVGNGFGWAGKHIDTKTY